MTKTIKIAGVISAFLAVTCGLISMIVIGPEHFGLIPQIGLLSGSVLGMVAFAAWMAEDMM
jgi:hypothetical protein